MDANPGTNPLKPRVAYVWSLPLMQASSALPSNPRRSAIVANLVRATGLLTPSDTLKLIKPSPASDEDLASYHDREYVRYITDTATASCADTIGTHEETLSVDDGFGLTDDCPLFPQLPAYVRLVAGASISAAEALRQNLADVAICWDFRDLKGGRHHALRAKASGYCYVQDVVLAIQRLRRLPQNSSLPRPKIMYIDLDLHYSDAVSQAFAGSNSASILTLSIHHSSKGFYPATPHSEMTRPDTTDIFTLSIPFKRGASNSTYAHIWPSVQGVFRVFAPTYVVVQCGADALSGDPCRVFNLGLDVNLPGSFGWMVNQIVNWGSKVLLLGGGGYNSPNVARAWTYITSIACRIPLDLDGTIPDHVFFPLYGPSFTFDVPAGNMRDENSSEDLDEINSTFHVLAERIRIRCGT